MDDDRKVINFARGLGPKYRTFRTVMLGKAPYPTLSQLIIALRGFDLREDEEDNSQQVNHNMAFAAQKSPNNRGRGNYYNRRANYNFRGRGFRPAEQGNNQTTQEHSTQQYQGSGNAPKGQENSGSSSCQICGRNNHTALKCFYRWDFSYQAQEDLPQELASLNISNQNGGDNAHYMDSGASTHMHSHDQYYR